MSFRGFAPGFFGVVNGLGDRNPQLMRELKGRLKPTAVAMAIGASLLAQFIGFLYAWGLLPEPGNAQHRYCTLLDPKGDTPGCTPIDAKGLIAPLVHWPQWWTDLFQGVSWAMVLVLLVSGVYLLISDLSKESRTGTLNFIRTSPQTSSSILLGKLLGVPAIPFILVLTAVPLHLWAAVQAQMPAKFVLSFYLFTGVVTAFYYTGALLFALLGGIPLLGASQGWLGAAATAGSLWLAFASWQYDNVGLSYNYGRHPFFGLREYFYHVIDSRLAYALPLGLLTFGIGTYWVWQALQRRFSDPQAACLSKGQSYWATASFELWLLGLVSYNLSPTRNVYSDHYYDVTGDLAGLAFMNFLWFMLLIAALTPQRQTLMDWARYRQHPQRPTDEPETRGNGGFGKRRGLAWDLVWGERSPALGAIALNLVVTGLIFAPWVLSRPPHICPEVDGVNRGL